MNQKEVIIQLTDEERLVLVSEEKSILESALDEGIKLIHSCKKGLCGSCRATLLAGEVDMKDNFSLTDEELAAGLILLCQSYPTSKGVVVDPVRKPKSKSIIL